MKGQFKIFINLMVLWFALVAPHAQADFSFEDLTADNRVQDRIDLFNDRDTPGIRIQMGEIKLMNKKFGIGTVNEALDSYQNSLKNRIAGFSNLHPGINVRLMRTDFKGFFIACEPMPNCMELFQNFVANSSDLFEKITIPGGGKLPLTVSRANNYSESYILARTMQNYPEWDGITPPVNEFLSQKIEKLVNPKKPINMNTLSENIAAVRRDGLEAAEPQYRKLITLIDSLEVPFASANNLDRELSQALRPGYIQKNSKNGIVINKAQSGDDLYIVVKNSKGETLRIIGADARGLGVMNMTERYEELIKKLKTEGITSMKDIFDVSFRGIRGADSQMFGSMDRYMDLLEDELEKLPNTVKSNGIEEASERAAAKYMAEVETNHRLMPMRTASIEACDLRECLDLMTEKHNALKKIEESEAARKIDRRARLRKSDGSRTCMPNLLRDQLKLLPPATHP